jgi:hypothetical protein
VTDETPFHIAARGQKDTLLICTCSGDTRLQQLASVGMYADNVVLCTCAMGAGLGSQLLVLRRSRGGV